MGHLKNKYAHAGFTIIELTVAIAVIGILAVVLIFSVNGWRTTTAKNEVKSDLNGLAAAMENVRNFNNGYPLSLPASYKSSPNVTVTYTSGTTASYCVDAVSDVIPSVQYYINSANTQDPVPGTCAGSTIVNLALNPSLEVNASGWAIHTGLTGGRVQVGGKWVFQGSRNATGAVAIYPVQNTPSAITSGNTYTASALVTSSVAQSIQLVVRQGGTSTTICSPSAVALAANTPTRLSASCIMNVASIYPVVLSASGAVGNVLTVDEVMITAGPTVYGYADGSTPGWSWTGTPHSSTSTGPAP